jgi:hypothetical protein
MLCDGNIDTQPAPVVPGFCHLVDQHHYIRDGDGDGDFNSERLVVKTELDKLTLSTHGCC